MRLRCALRCKEGALHPPRAARLRLPPVQPEGETNPLKFSQTFHLAPVGGSFVVTNGESGPRAARLPAPRPGLHGSWLVLDAG